jgi:putrescine transport system substrate-binding protein
MKLISSVLALVIASSAQAQDVLRVYNWTNYIDQRVLEGFTKETGIRVEYETFSTADELDQAIARNEAYDVIVPSHFQLERLIENKKLARLDNNKLKNYRSLDPGLLAMLAGIDSANEYVAPYLWGAVGIAVNPARAEATYGESLPNSWSLLFDETQVRRLAQCGVGMLDAPEETASLWFNYRGRSLNRVGSRQIERNLQPLMAITPLLKSMDNDSYITALADGKLCIAMAWVGHALTAAQTNPELRFQIPNEGAMVFIDSLAIPRNAPHPELAYRFIDYLLKPSNALINARATRFYSTLLSSSKEQQILAKEQPMQVLNVQERRRLYVLERLSHEQKTALDKTWEQIKAVHRPQYVGETGSR